jgi:16S rRNA (cytosine1402-N4)-methyltransferase
MEHEAYHIPVLLHEAIDALQIDPNGVYADVTFGGGGHSAELLKKLENGRLFGFDQDPAAKANVPDDERFVFIPQNFRHLRNALLLYRVKKLDGILADLGVSSRQFDDASRGFSLRGDAALDMRMNPSNGISAAQILNEWEESELASLLREFGEVEKAKLVARKICERRAVQPINTTAELSDLIKPYAQRGKEHKFLAQVFQALRIQVNDELAALSDLLHQSAEVLKPGGRLVVISYHSLEDRMVKNFMRSGSFNTEVQRDFYGNAIRPFQPISSKALVPSDDEIMHNPRSRSAKMRIAQRLP